MFIKTVALALGILSFSAATASAQAYEAITVAPNGAFGVGWGNSNNHARVQARNACRGCGTIASGQSYGTIIAIYCRSNGWENSFVDGGTSWDAAMRNVYYRANRGGYPGNRCRVIASR